MSIFHFIICLFIDRYVKIYGSLQNLSDDSTRFFIPEISKKLKHNKKGTVSFVTHQVPTSPNLPNIVNVAGSQFFITLTDDHLDYLDGKHAIIGRVVEGLDVLDKINDEMVDDNFCPFVDLRIKHTIILDDPFPDPTNFRFPSRSPSPTPSLLYTTQITESEYNKSIQNSTLTAEEQELIQKEEEKKRLEDEAAARALTLEMVGDLPFAEIRPPENILFVCKLNPVTTDEDLDIIFSRFGKIH
ncbi:Peptidyl-prolyl cis-trans isomerase cyp6, partial [Nowakowskiella sp. JEL0078]